jgi:ribonuclease J
MKECEGKPVFILQSTANIDRLVSFYRASKRSGRVLFMDDYQAAIANAAGGNIPRPDNFSDVYAFTSKGIDGERYYKFNLIKQKWSLDGITKNGNFTMMVRQSMLGYLLAMSKRMDIAGGVLIYSMWEGYKKDSKMQTFLKRVEELGIKVVTLHTSGHATEEDIELLKQRIVADEPIMVHTEAKENK